MPHCCGFDHSYSSLFELRKQILLIATNAGDGHIASAFSILDILWVLYDRVLNVYPEDPTFIERDKFILSKGHGSLALYTVLAQKGFFPQAELDHFVSFDSCLGGHPDCLRVPGVEASTGSLGHGLPIGVGMALGMRIRRSDSRVVVLVGDAECNEGSIWEALLLAGHHKLCNLTCIVDNNHSSDRSLGLYDIAKKFEAFGWDATTVCGHNQEALYTALLARSDRPNVIVAETIKGFGCKRMENNPEWHHKVPTDDDLDDILEELS